MKKNPSRKILLLCTLVTISLLARTHAQAGVPTCTQASASAHEVTASKYADFLNQVATASDPHLFYDEQMATDPEAGCIVRVGEPGQWHYEVIAGRENFPVRYVHQVGKNAYSGWSGDPIFYDEKICDASLKCNTSSFEVETASAPTSSLAVDSFSRSNDSRFSSNEKCYFAIATGLAFAAFGHELMMRPGGEGVAGAGGDRATVVEGEATEYDAAGARQAEHVELTASSSSVASSRANRVDEFRTMVRTASSHTVGDAAEATKTDDIKSNDEKVEVENKLSEESLNKKIAELKVKAEDAKNFSKEARARGDIATAELQKQVASALGGDRINPGATYAYVQAAEAQKQGRPQAAEAYRKSALAYEAQAEAFSQGDMAAAELQEKAARALGGNVANPGAAYVYSQAAEEQKQGNTQIANTQFKSALAYEAQAEALSKGDTDVLELQEQIVKALGGDEFYPGAAYAYEQAALEQKKGNTQAAEAWHKSALAYEACAEALSKGDTDDAEIQKQVANVLGGNGNKPGAAYAYKWAANEQKYGETQAAETYRKRALAYEAQAEALSKGDMVAVKLQELIATVLGGYEWNPGAAYAHERAADEREKGHTQAAKAWLKSALAHEAQAEALSQGDTNSAEFQKQAATALGGDKYNQGAATAYKKAASEQQDGNTQVAEIYRKSALAYEAQAEALFKGDTTAAELQKQIARALGGRDYNSGASYAYKQAAYEQKKGNDQVAGFYRKIALAYEAQAEALSKGDRVAAELQGKIATALGGDSKNSGVIDAYGQAAEEQKKGNTQAAETYRKSALAYEACVETLSKGGKDAAEFQRQAARVFGGNYRTPGAAYVYGKADDEQKRGCTQAAEAYRKSALAYEACAEALFKGDMVVAKLQDQIATALGGCYSNSGAAYAYSQASYQQKNGNTQVAETYHKSALAYEACAEAFSKGDTTAAELQKEIGSVWGGDDHNPGATYAYSQAAYQQEKGNTQAAEVWRKSALAYEACAEALFQGDIVAAELQKQAGTALGGSIKTPGATGAYKKAAKEQEKGNTQAAEIWQKCALAHEAQAEALFKRDMIAAELQKQIATVLEGNDENQSAAYVYWEAISERSKGHFRAANILFKEAQEQEAKAESLAQEIQAMAAAPRNSEEYTIRATEAFEKTVEVFYQFVTASKRAHEATSSSDFDTIANEIKKIKAEAKKILTEYDKQINEFPRILEKASASVTEEAPITKAWFEEQLQTAKKIKMELHTALIDCLDFGADSHQAVFWTGYVDGNQTLAMLFSKKSDKRTLEMTAGGGFLDDLNLYGRESTVSVQLANDLFDLASERFARGAMGEINAFLPNAEPRANSVFKRIEEPILTSNPSVQLTWHVRPKYDYWRTISEREEEKDIRLAFKEAARLLNHDESHDWIRASNVLRNASESLGLAFESSNQAIKTSHLEEAVALWDEAIIQAHATQELWSQAAEMFEQAKEQIPETLKTHLPRLLARLNEERVSWLAEIKWRQLRHKAAIADAEQENVATLLASSDNAASLKAMLSDVPPLMTACEEAADEWKRSEEAIATSGEVAAQKEKEYNHLKNTVAFSRSKIAFSKAAAEVMDAFNKASTAIGEKAKKRCSHKLSETLETYYDVIGDYQQFLQHVENNAPTEWNTTHGWHGIATDWEKNKKDIETAKRKMALKTGELGAKKEERQTGSGNEEDQADHDKPTKWADFWKSFQEDNQPLVNQFSKEINKLVLDMAGGKRLPEIPASAEVTSGDTLRK